MVLVRLKALNILTKETIEKLKNDPYNDNEKAWMRGFCIDKGINAKARIQELLNYINK